MDNGSLLVNIALCIRMMVPVVEGMKCPAANCKSFASRLKLLKQLFDELRQSKYPLSDSTITAFESLYLTLQNAKNMLGKFSKGSKIYSVLRSHQISSQFRAVNTEIERDVSAARLKSPRVSKQIQHLAEKCVEEFNKAAYPADCLDDQIRQEIENYLVEHREGKKTSLERLQKVAAFMDVSTKEEVAEELAALEKARKEAGLEKNKTEEEYIDRVISLFMQLAEDDFDGGQSKADIQAVRIPADFRCPLSLELMYDPVIVASGQTYEKAYIQHWLDQGNTRCPKTGQVLAHTNLIPNYTVKALIAAWCQMNDVPLPKVDAVKSTNWLALTRLELEAAEKQTEASADMPEEKLDEAEESHSVASAPKSLSKPADGIELMDRRPRSCSAGEFEALGLSSRNSPDARSSSSVHTPTGLKKQQQEANATTLSPEADPVIQQLVEDLQSNDAKLQQAAAGELRLLARDSMYHRTRIPEAGAIKLLVALLSSSGEATQENAVTALLNLSLCDNNKAKIAGEGAIEPLINVLETGTPDAKTNAAATLYSLSVKEDYKGIIGASGAIPPLVELLKSGLPRGKKDAVTALFNLSLCAENKLRIVEAGAVKPLIELIGEPRMGMVDKAVQVLASLSTINEGKAAIGQEGGIPALVEVLEAGGPRTKELAAAALLNLCASCRKFATMTLQEGAFPALHHLSQTGSARAREKAAGLLRLFRDQRQTSLGRHNGRARHA